MYHLSSGHVGLKPTPYHQPRHGAGSLALVEPLLDGCQAVGVVVLCYHSIHHYLLLVRHALSHSIQYMVIVRMSTPHLGFVRIGS
jgi:hypothetical protein